MNVRATLIQMEYDERQRVTKNCMALNYAPSVSARESSRCDMTSTIH